MALSSDALVEWWYRGGELTHCTGRQGEAGMAEVYCSMVEVLSPCLQRPLHLKVGHSTLLGVSWRGGETLMQPGLLTFVVSQKDDLKPSRWLELKLYLVLFTMGSDDRLRALDSSIIAAPEGWSSCGCQRTVIVRANICTMVWRGWEKWFVASPANGVRAHTTMDGTLDFDQADPKYPASLCLHGCRVGVNSRINPWDRNWIKAGAQDPSRPFPDLAVTKADNSLAKIHNNY